MLSDDTYDWTDAMNVANFVSSGGISGESQFIDTSNKVSASSVVGDVLNLFTSFGASIVAPSSTAPTTLQAYSVTPVASKQNNWIMPAALVGGLILLVMALKK